MPRHSFFFRFLLLFCLLLLVSFCSAAESAQENAPEELIYGTSESGRPLTCVQLGRADASHALLLTFGVHGFEDDYDHDGEVLRLIAWRVIDHFSAHPEDLHDLRLCIVPSANPDGLIDGTTRNGFGRCNALGININRDFPVGWEEDYHRRDKTGAEPFAAAESRALRDLTDQFMPTHAVDVHGWIDAVYGSGPMADCFAQAFGMKLKSIRSGGTLTQWLDSIIEEAVLLELPPHPNLKQYVDVNSEKLIDAICSLSASF